MRTSPLLSLVVALVALLAPSTANAARSGQWSVSCSYTHMLPDDPIVSPGAPGASHMHDFSGAHATNAFTLSSSLLARPTSCNRIADHSAYWVPTLYQDGVAVHPREFRVYYRGSGFDGRAVRPFPRGLRLIAGDGRRTDIDRPQPVSVASWACTIFGGGAAGDEVEVPHVPADCGGAPLRMRIVFPQCWNGRSLDSRDHRSHMAYAPREGVCPATHPVPVPQLTLSIRYWVPHTRDIVLSSGGTHSQHADFMNGWEGTSQERLVRRCIQSYVDCAGERL